MGNFGEGTVEIGFEEFWDFVNGYNINAKEYCTKYGVPRVNLENQVVEVDYMFNSEISIEDQAEYKDSKVHKQWQELKNK